MCHFRSSQVSLTSGQKWSGQVQKRDGKKQKQSAVSQDIHLYCVYLSKFRGDYHQIQLMKYKKSTEYTWDDKLGPQEVKFKV